MTRFKIDKFCQFTEDKVKHMKTLYVLPLLSFFSLKPKRISDIILSLFSCDQNSIVH